MLFESVPHSDTHMHGNTVVSRVSAHGRLNITSDFGPHGRLARIKIPHVCIEAATVALEMWYMGACPGHYGIYGQFLIMHSCIAVTHGLKEFQYYRQMLVRP